MKWYLIVGLVICGILLQGWGVPQGSNPGNMPVYYYQTQQNNGQQDQQGQQGQQNPNATGGANPAAGCPIQTQITADSSGNVQVAGAAPLGNNGQIQFVFGSNGQWAVQINFGGMTTGASGGGNSNSQAQA